MHFDTVIAASMNDAQRNVLRTHGPRCPNCSGLGRHFRLEPKMRVTRTQQCQPCSGHGLDLTRLERHIEGLSHDALWKQIHEIESRAGLPLSSRYRYPGIKASRQSWVECIFASAVDGTAIASSTTETIIFPNVTIPGNYMENGRALKVTVAGKFGTHSSGTVTHVFKIRYNSTSGATLATTGTVTLVISLTNARFEFEVDLVTRTNGTSGAILADGRAICYGGTAPTIGSATGAPAVAPMTVGGQTGPANSAAVDLTVDWPLVITATHGANQAANTLTGMHYTLESLN